MHRIIYNVFIFFLLAYAHSIFGQGHKNISIGEIENGQKIDALTIIGKNTFAGINLAENKIIHFNSDGDFIKTLESNFSLPQNSIEKLNVFLNTGPNSYLLVSSESTPYRYENNQFKAVLIEGVEEKLFDKVVDGFETNDGLLYLVDQGKKQIIEVNPEVGIRSVIYPSNGSFSTPIAIHPGPDGELFILDRKISSISKINKTTGVKADISLVDAGGKKISDPLDLVILRNGHIIVLNEEGWLYNYDKNGKHLSQEQLVNGKNDSYRLVTSPRWTDVMAFFDPNSQQVKLIQTSSPVASFQKSDQIEFKESKRNSIWASSYTHNNGTKFTIKDGDLKTLHILGKDGSLMKTLTSHFKKATHVSGTGDRVYVLDQDRKSVSILDLSGTVLKEIGNRGQQKLKRPTGLTLLLNGTIAVADSDLKGIVLYDSDGGYKELLQFREISKPQAIYSNSRSELVVWDESSNGVYIIDPVGKNISNHILRPRSANGDRSPGIIGAVMVDPLDQILIFNKKNKEISIYRWKTKPLLVHHFYKPGISGSSFEGNDEFFLDPATYRLHVLGDNAGVYQFSVTPPTPDNLYRFEARKQNLLVYYKPVESPFASSYGLVLADENGEMELQTTTSNNEPFILSELETGSLDVTNRYRLVSMNPSAMSAPTAGFDNFFGQGNRAYNAGKYDKASLAYQKALNYMGRHESMVKFISDQFLNMGRSRINDLDSYEGLDYLQTAYYINPACRSCATELANGYTSIFWKLSAQNSFKDIVSMTDEEINDPYLRPTLITTIDSISNVFARLSNFTSLENAKLLKKKLVDWDPDNPEYLLSLGRVSLDLFERMRGIGMPSLELNILTFEAEQSLKKALSLFKGQPKKALETSLLYLAILEKRGKYADLEKEAQSILTQNNDRLNQQQKSTLREFLARGFYGQGNYDKAIEQFEYLIGNNPGNREMQQQLADIYLKNDNIVDAKAIYQQLLLDDRDNPDLIGNIGLVELADRNFVEASYQLERSLKLEPSNYQFRGPLGEAFERSGNINKALENFLNAIDYYRQHRSARSTTTLEFATPISNTDQLITYLLKVGDLYNKTGQLNKALDIYDEVIGIDEGNDKGWYGLGKASLSAGLVYDAMNAFFEAKSIDPNNPAYASAYQDATTMRSRISKNQPPLKIEKVEVKEVYPSLYINYGIANKLPLGEITVSNNTSAPINSARVSVNIPGLMPGPTTKEIGILLAYSNTSLPISALFNESILNQTSQKTFQASIELTYYFNGSQKRLNQSVPITVYGRNAITWSDKRKLASFIAPDVDELIQYARDIDRSLTGELSYEIPTNLNKALQVYTVLNNSDIRYTPDPNQNYATVSNNSQILDYLQYPAETLTRKSGDCDDLVALFCGLLENAGVATAYVDIPGHVFLGIDLDIEADQLIYSGIPSDMVVIHNERAWLPIETTLIGNADFSEAWKKGALQYRQTINSGIYPELIPLADARNVYVASSYVPSGFRGGPAISATMENEYSTELGRIVVLTNEGLLKRLESQYRNEPNNIFVKNKYGILLAKTGELERAKEVFVQAFQLVPSNPSVLNNLGNIEYASRRYSDALKYYLRSVQYDDSDVQSMINVSKTYHAIGNLEEARKWFEKAKELNNNIAQYFSDYQNQLK